MAGVVLLKCEFVLGKKLIYLSYDLPFLHRPVARPDDVVCVYMDDEAYKELHRSFIVPWDRELHAQLLERLTKEHAKAVVFDIVFSDPGPDATVDDHFARAMRENGKVVLAADWVPAGSGLAEGMTITPPYTLFSDAVSNHWGLAQLREDYDAEIRQHFFGMRDSPYSTIAWVTAEMLGVKIAQDPNERFHERWMNYYGPPLTLERCSYWRALYPDGTPPGYFSNKVVYVGAHLLSVLAGERKDEFRNPYTSTFRKRNPNEIIFMPGVEVQATAFLNLLRGDWLERTNESFELFIVIASGILFGFGLITLRPIRATGVAVVAAFLIYAIAQMLFWKARLWFPWMIIVAAQIPLALLWSILINSVQLYVENRLYQQSLSMYLSPKLVKKFASEKDILKPGARKQMLTILFSDIASFTSISEGMDSDELAHEMNEYFQGAVSNCIHATDGTIVKYIGDAIFAFWNAPDGQIDHAMRGCEAALRFRDQPQQYINGQLLVTRIGLHTGVANVGNFGSTARVDYTAIGENINLASRMEGLNKHLGTDILITETVHEGVEGRLMTRFLGKFQMKGFEKAVGVYELAGPLDKAESLRTLHEMFANAVKLFQQKKLDEAEAAFRKILEKFPDEGPTKFYVKFIAELRENPLPEDWNGEIELKEK